MVGFGSPLSQYAVPPLISFRSIVGKPCRHPSAHSAGRLGGIAMYPSLVRALTNPSASAEVNYHNFLKAYHLPLARTGRGILCRAQNRGQWHQKGWN